MNRIIDVEAVVDAPVAPKTRKNRRAKKVAASKAKAKPKPARKKGQVILCHWNGRFGNRMHQYAYGTTYAKRFRIDFYLPSDWEGTRLFKKQYHKVIEDEDLRLYLNQTQKEFDTLESRTNAMKTYGHKEGYNFEYLNPDNPTDTYCGKKTVFFDSVCAYNPSVFKGMSAKYLKKIFEFSEHIKSLDDYKRLEDKQGTYDIAHLRRDDISNADYNQKNVQGYSVLSKKAYNQAFEKYGYDPKEVLWVSDDYTKQWHADREDRGRGGWRYPEGCTYMGPDIVFDWLHDFLQLYFARTIFRANSSFSWWAGFLSPAAKVYSPIVNEQFIYGRDNDGEKKELDLEFVEGNEQHWMHNQGEIIFKP